jgi:hypothetical protein
MYKADSLREHLVHANPTMRQNPETLHTFIDEGSIRATGTKSLSFEYNYRFNIIITDYPGDEDAIIVPILAWIKVHQSDLLDGGELHKGGLIFEVDFNNAASIDFSIKLQLTERVIVKNDKQGRLDISHPDELQPTPAYHAPFWTLYNRDNLMAEWHMPDAV